VDILRRAAFFGLRTGIMGAAAPAFFEVCRSFLLAGMDFSDTPDS
jgi:hypothetical protein